MGFRKSTKTVSWIKYSDCYTYVSSTIFDRFFQILLPLMQEKIAYLHTQGKLAILSPMDSYLICNEKLILLPFTQL